MREESLLDIMANSADTECEERPVNRYGSPLARRSSGDVGETAQVPSSRVVSFDELLVLVGGENVLVHYFELKYVWKVLSSVGLFLDLRVQEQL